MSAITGCEQSQQSSPLFDHLVGAGEKRGRNVEGKCLRAAEVDHQFVLGRELDRQIGWLFPESDQPWFQLGEPF